METEQRKELWYQALFEADCMKVMKLLEDDPTLLRVGWTAEPNREVRGSPDNYWAPKDPSVWKGRTVLHVAARRGCVKLIEQVLELCRLEGIEYVSPFLHAEQESITYRYVLSKERGRNRVEQLQQVTEETEVVGLVSMRGDPQPELDSAQAAKTPSSDGRPVPSGEGEGEGEGADIEDRETTKSTRGPSSRTKPQAERGSKLETAQRAAQSTQIESLPLIGKAAVDGNDRQKKSGWKKLRQVRKVPSAISFWKRKASGEKASIQQASRHLSDSPCSPRHFRFGEGGSMDPDEICTELINRKDLRDLLLSIDGEFELDALAMATLTGKKNLILPLVYAIGECERPPYKILKTSISRETLPEAAKIISNRDKLREATNDAMDRVVSLHSYRAIYQTQFLDEYSKHPDFNFLPRADYIYHFSLSSRFLRDGGSPALCGAVRLFQEITRENIERAHDDELWRFFWELQDGQGRPPPHVSVDEGTVSGLTVGRELFTVAIAARDGAGRPLSLREAAVRTDWHGRCKSFLMGARNDILGNAYAARALYVEPWAARMTEIEQFFALDDLSSSNGFRGIDSVRRRLTPIHAAIIHKNLAYLKALIYFALSPSTMTRSDRTWMSRLLYDFQIEREDFNLDLTGLACFVGDVELVKLVKAQLMSNLSSSVIDGNIQQNSAFHWPATHIAAHQGNYKMLELLLDIPSCDPFIEDRFGNTALHNAMKVYPTEFKPHLLDYISCNHLLSNDMRKASRKANKTEDGDVQRQGCIILLLQAGCDVFKTNQSGKIPYPRGILSENEKFMTWWYQRQSREFEIIQSNMNTASNAISVTAALVATASYVGPLQPPLGLGTTTDQIRSENGWVATFIFCDSLSFYLAIAAIILSLIPSLPMPEQSMKSEIRRTKRLVTMAVGALFPSVICVLIAFGSSSMAVFGANILPTTGGKLTVATMCIGGPVIGITFFLFMVRLLGIVFPRNVLLKYLHKITSF